MTKDELEEIYQRLCLDIQQKTKIYNALGDEIDRLHAKAEDLEYSLANYDDEDTEPASSTRTTTGRAG